MHTSCSPYVPNFPLPFSLQSFTCAKHYWARISLKVSLHSLCTVPKTMRVRTMGKSGPLRTVILFILSHTLWSYVGLKWFVALMPGFCSAVKCQPENWGNKSLKVMPQYFCGCQARDNASLFQLLITACLCAVLSLQVISNFSRRSKEKC